jgi:hypothetical protein
MRSAVRGLKRSITRLEVLAMAKIQKTSLKSLHPTQLTIGMIVVRDKKKHLTAMTPAQQEDFLQAHPMPAVMGPKNTLYITDHHHLGRAGIEAGIDSAYVSVEDDLSSHDDFEKFWKAMNKSLWVHPLDANGVRHYYSMIPNCLDKLVDDAYRSLAGYVRDAGGYDKTPTAFAEFIWADFFRRNVPIEDLQSDFNSAVREALPLAQSGIAKGIPGFNGK